MYLLICEQFEIDMWHAFTIPYLSLSPFLCFSLYTWLPDPLQLSVSSNLQFLLFCCPFHLLQIYAMHNELHWHQHIDKNIYDIYAHMYVCALRLMTIFLRFYAEHTNILTLTLAFILQQANNILFHNNDNNKNNKIKYNWNHRIRWWVGYVSCSHTTAHELIKDCIHFIEMHFK